MKQTTTVKKYVRQYSMALFFIILFALSALFVPRFATPSNLINISTQIAINGLLACGMTFVILIGGIDLSVGSVAGLTGILTSAIVVQLQDISIVSSVALIFGVALVIGTLSGLFIAFFVTYLNVPPFIATLAANNVARGLAYVYTQSKPIYGLPENFNWLGLSGRVGPIPVIVILMAVILLLAYLFLSKTSTGRYLYAVGSNEEVAVLSGIRVNRIKFLAYLTCSIMAALAGACYASQLQAGQPNAGDGYELMAIAAVAMGGTSMSGGVGGIAQTTLGILIIGVINNALNLLSVSSYWQKVIMGIIILVAVVFDVSRSRAEE